MHDQPLRPRETRAPATEAPIGTEARVWHDAFAFDDLYRGECFYSAVDDIVAGIPPGRPDLMRHWQRVFDRVGAIRIARYRVN